MPVETGSVPGSEGQYPGVTDVFPGVPGGTGVTPPPTSTPWTNDELLQLFA